MARRIALGVLVLGLLLFVMERRLTWQTGDIIVLGGLGMRLVIVAWILIVLGGGAFAAFWLYPPARTLAVRLAPSQEEEWERVREEARMWNLLQWVGFGLLVGGLLLGAIAYSALPDSQVVAGAGFLIFLGVAGGGLLFAAWSRRHTLHRLYIQTLVLSRLENTGLGPGASQALPEVVKENDERVAPVLRALDDLLGHLPDHVVQQFLSSDEAQAYLELIEEAQAEGRDG